MTPHFDRALLLIQQSRHEMAEQELRQVLAQEPDNAFAHSLLAVCLLEREDFKQATEEAALGIRLAPDMSYAHYVMCRVYNTRNFAREAMQCIQEAIRLDPYDADYFSMLAALHYGESRWNDALAAAEQGLQLDAEHVACTNLRAMALVKLGRREVASQAIDAALRKNPENSVTHANQGWTLLDQGDPSKALEHFRESLRLDPENEWAQQGIVEALKARHFIYALMLRYFLFMAKLSPKAQWGIILGGYFGNRILGEVSRSNPDLAPWLWPLRILYLAFVILTWTADPLFNLLLRLNRFGRLALSREQIVASNWIGLSLFGGLGLLVLAFVLDLGLLLLLGIASCLLVLPLSGVFKCPKGWPRWVMIGYAVVLVAVAVAAAVLFAGADKDEREVGTTLAGFYVLGVFLSGWVINLLMMVRPRR